MRLKKPSMFLALILVGMSLAACSSSLKDYADAKPLSTINTTVKVEALWVASTGEVPDDAYAQLPVTVDKNKKLYVANRKGVVAAYDAVSGVGLWQVNMGEALTGGPGIGDDLLLVATREAELVALKKATGAEQWRQKISSEMLAPPVVADNSIVVQTIDGKISLYETSTGAKVWSYNRTIPKLTLRGTSAPLIMNDVVLAGFSDGRLVSLSLATGELLWETTIAAARGRTDLERLVDIDGLFQAADGVVYVSSFQGRVAAVSVSNGNVLWARDMSSYTGLTVSGSQIFITDADSKVWALDGRTGATLWRQDNLLARELSAPAVLGDTVVVADYDGFVHWLSRDDGEFVARKSIDKVWSRMRYAWGDDEAAEDVFRSVTVSPLVVANTLYVRDNTGSLVAFTLAK